MAWNRPSKKKVEVEGRGRQWNVHLKGLIAGVIVVVGAAVTAWWLWPSADRAGETPPPQKEGLIKEVKPTAAKIVPAAPVAVTNAPKRFDPKNPHALNPADNGFVVRGDFRQDAPEVAEMRERVKRIETKFKRHSEMLLCGMLYQAPDDMYIERDFTPEFMKDVIASLEEPIEIAEDDHPLVREQKEEMIAFKKDLQHIYKLGGENLLHDKLVQMQDEIQAAGAAVQQMKTLIEEQVAAGVGGSDLVDLTDAAEKLLEKKGIKCSLTTAHVERERQRMERQAKKRKAVK